MGSMRFAVFSSVAVLALVPALASAGTSKPRLSLVQRSPAVVLVGSGFESGESVSVTLMTGYAARHVRVVARAGRFRVTFRVPGSGCGVAWLARARGNRGSTAVLKLGEGSPCVPPPIR